MSEACQVERFLFGAIGVQLLLPRRLQPPGTSESTSAIIPYWAKLWPSALALGSYIAGHPQLIVGKKVLELAAGLGLPGIVAAHLASEVVISDYAPEAVVTIRSSVELNGLGNVQCQVIDWNSLPPDLESEVILLSDINYDPAAFEVLYDVLQDFLAKGSTLILATPQRLMAKPFIERLLPDCVEQDEQLIQLNGESAFISLFVLAR